MHPVSYAALTLFLNVASAVAVNHNHSFISLVSSQKAFNAPEEPGDNDFDQAPESAGKGGAPKKNVIETITGLFKHQDKTTTKKKNNLLVLDFAGYKNVRGKKVVDVSHLQVQKSSSLFTQNTDKGVLHFQTTTNKMAGKGTLGRATLKLTKMFDAKNLGFKCNSNSLQVYLIEPLGENLKMKVLKGPVRMEFKKDEVEVDVSNLFEDLDEGDSGSNLTGSVSALQLKSMVMKENDDDIDFDQEGSGDRKADGSSEDGSEDGFFGTTGSKAKEEAAEPSRTDSVIDRYLMLEADPNCYFAFDVNKNKPKVKLEMSKSVTNTIKGTYKKSAIGVGLVGTLLLLGGVGYFIKYRGRDQTFVFDGQTNDGMIGF